MANTKKPQTPTTKIVANKNEEAMIAGILEGSPDGIGVAVVRLDCECRKMAAVDKNGEPASKVIMYRDGANAICELCAKDNGAFARVKESFISWSEPAPAPHMQQMIKNKVLGSGGH